jgi:hypothetical protein
MRQVTYEEFFKVLNAVRLNIVSESTGNYPYISVFKYAESRSEFGRIVPHNPVVYKKDGLGDIEKDYFLNR